MRVEVESPNISIVFDAVLFWTYLKAFSNSKKK
jgi:hypothetical protein